MTIDGCELKLLAKDSVIIHGRDNSSPRDVSSMFFAPSSRADVAVHCPGSSSGTTNYELVADGTTVANIQVTGTSTSATTNLTKFNPLSIIFRKFIRL